MKKRKIAVVIGSRANYSSAKSAMRAIKNHPMLQLQVIAVASALIDRYGAVVDLIKKDGFDIDACLYTLIEGENPITMAKSTGLGLIELASALENLTPDFVLTIGDRFETMATTLAAAYMNIPIAHTMGGEVTGTIDESIRHAVTKFAHVHFVASYDAQKRVEKLGEKKEDIHLVGCPRIDIVKEVLKENEDKVLKKIFSFGVGKEIDINKPFILVSQHPVTTEYGSGEAQIVETLKAIERINLPVIILWPNADAGSNDVARGIRKWREKRLDKNSHLFKNLPFNVYIQLMKKTACLVGNSSSGIREGAFIGTPVVNIGSRQQSRERGKNVIDVGYNQNEIYRSIKRQLSHGHYMKDPIYGKGNAGKKIAEILSTKKVNLQKKITY